MRAGEICSFTLCNFHVFLSSIYVLYIYELDLIHETFIFFVSLASLSAYHDVRLTINTIAVLEKLLSKKRIVCFYILRMCPKL